MKKLSIKEKAKAYDKAIEKLRNAFYGNNSRMCEEYRQAVIRIIEPIFPELKKPEDEEIRKGLIENFKWFCGDYPETAKWGKDDNLLVKDIIAWLEKQGKVPVTINIDKMVEDYANNEDCDNEGFGKPVNCMIRAYRQGLTDAIATVMLEKQGEQKPQRMISAEAKEAMYGKPAWSENDEYTIERLSYLLDNEQENYPQLSCDFQEIQEFKDWLKSIKQRIRG